MGIPNQSLLKVPTEVYSRVCGYYRPVNQWNKGKQSEFEDRKDIDINKFK
jgi:ribonucleoside-triphosphate reductase (formate)